MNNKENYSRNVLSPVFSTKEQEELFSECARKSMDINARLTWDNNDSMSSGKTILSPVFRTKEQEELFAKCARESMSLDAMLTWDGKEEKVKVKKLK